MSMPLLSVAKIKSFVTSEKFNSHSIALVFNSELRCAPKRVYNSLLPNFGSQKGTDKT
jgi:hypothetical protein